MEVYIHDSWAKVKEKGRRGAQFLALRPAWSGHKRNVGDQSWKKAIESLWHAVTCLVIIVEHLDFLADGTEERWWVKNFAMIWFAIWKLYTKDYTERIDGWSTECSLWDIYVVYVTTTRKDCNDDKRNNRKKNMMRLDAH
jgi:hypothetical protein